jgi:hypothetical protein
MGRKFDVAERKSCQLPAEIPDAAIQSGDGV